VTDSRSSIAALSDQLADAVAAASPSVVAVHARPRLPSTGVHWKDGVVVTTEGTVRQEEDITITLPPPDGRRIPATFAGRDRGTDLAVLRIPPGSLPVAELGDPAVLRPGNLVLALGRLDEGGARAAFGAVSATGGKWRAWKGGEIDRWLQSDLTIYPGFGGGPLVDSTGQIHGINSGALSRRLERRRDRSLAAIGPHDLPRFRRRTSGRHNGANSWHQLRCAESSTGDHDSGRDGQPRRSPAPRARLRPARLDRRRHATGSNR